MVQYALSENRELITYPSMGYPSLVRHRLGNYWVVHFPRGVDNDGSYLALVRVSPITKRAGTLEVIRESDTGAFFDFFAAEVSLVETAMMLSGELSPWYVAQCAFRSKDCLNSRLIVLVDAIKRVTGATFPVALEIALEIERQ